MALSRVERKAFRQFLRKVDAELCSVLNVDSVIKFFTTIIDYKLNNEEFSQKIAAVFVSQPDKLKDPVILEAIRNIVVIREAMLGNHKNSEESRYLTQSYFANRIGSLRNERRVVEKEQMADELQSAHQILMEEHRSERQKLEERLKRLQEEQQNLHDIEIQEQKRRREEKRMEQEEIATQRQIEFEEEVEERRQRHREIDEQIEELRVELQQEHERQMRERKEVKMKREADMRERQQRQVAEQDKQSLERMRQKEKEKMMMQARQQGLLEQQMKQKKQRLAKKRQEEMQLKKVQEQLRSKLKRRTGKLGGGVKSDINIKGMDMGPRPSI